MSKFFNLKEYDVVFLSYDEPNANANWQNLKQRVPSAIRVHGIKGSDAAHKECARVTTTERIIIIDGDNWLWGDLLNQILELEDSIDDSKVVFSWPAKNAINGLKYGNGGIKCWPRQAILDMKTHENADPNNALAQIDFCWELNYIGLNQSFSTVINNTNKLQAWRAGFREGVKLSLNQGLKIDSIDEIDSTNLIRLRTWMSVGLDKANGIWAILGARQSCYKTIMTDWDFKNVRDFDWLNHFYEDSIKNMSESDAYSEILNLGKCLSHHMLTPPPFDEINSKLFKELMIHPDRKFSGVKNYQRHDFDIVMITYDEPNGDFNYTNLKKRFPEAKRIHGVKGIHQAHVEAAKICETKMFWIVDGDAEVDSKFNFVYDVQGDYESVRVWRSKNPINDLVYGYGGIKLFPRINTLNMDLSKPDMTTSISTKYIPVNQISNVTAFNTDEFNTWKSAFRECCKLASKIIDRQKNDETNERLDIWCNTGSDRPYGKYAIAGAIAGRKYGLANSNNLENLKKINDFEWLKEQYEHQKFN